MIQLDSPTVESIITSLGWTLLHFLWQGAVVGVLFGTALACASNAGARTRYHIGLFFLALLAALPLGTFLWLIPETAPATLAAQIAETLTVGAAGDSPATVAWQTLVQPYLPWAVLIWVFGVLLMTSRLILEWRAVRQLTRVDVSPLPAEWRARVVRLHERLKIHRAVQVLRSTRVHVPLVVGWLRPVILVPVSAFTGLTPWQLELILMHELAHVRRHDYIVNLVQVVVETLLFYHPVVRWVSRVVREEREHCCDDLVVARSGDALSYARALAELAGAQSLNLQTSVGSDGGKLLTRIKRLVVAHEPQRVSTHWSVGAMLAVFGMSISGLLQPGSQFVSERSEAEVLGDVAVPAIARALPAMSAAQGASAQEAQNSWSERPNMTSQGGMGPQAGATAEVESTPRMAAVASLPASPTAIATPVSRPAPVSGQTSEVPAPNASGKADVTAQSADTKAQGADATGQTAAAEASAGASQTEGGAGPEMPAPAAQSPDVADPAAQTMAAKSAPAQETAPLAVQGGSGEAAEVVPRAVESSERVARPLSGRAPEFPPDARLDGVEGWVKFTYRIARDGTVRSVEILDAQPRNVFENAVRRAVRSWRFEPVMLDGSSMEREVTQTIQFSLGPAAAEACDQTGTRLCR